ncbi:hypothetical protein ACOME3_008304 [Neoechinorhynchus agilis]
MKTESCPPKTSKVKRTTSMLLFQLRQPKVQHDRASQQHYVRLAFSDDDASEGSLVTKIKERISYFGENVTRYLSTANDLRKERVHEPDHRRNANWSPAGRVSSKLADGDVGGTVRLLSSMDSLAKDNEETLGTLRSKHPNDGGRQYFVG